jgi:hypothetical protein
MFDSSMQIVNDSGIFLNSDSLYQTMYALGPDGSSINKQLRERWGNRGVDCATFHLFDLDYYTSKL